MQFVILLLVLPFFTNLSDATDPYEAFIKMHGTNGLISAGEIQDILSGLAFKNSSSLKVSMSRLKKINEDCSNCNIPCENVTVILSKFNINPGQSLNWTELKKVMPGLLFRIQNPLCYLEEKQKEEKSKRPPIGSVWGYSMLMVTIINCCALLGFAFTPFIGRRVYKLIMAFMIALAVGSLAGSAVLFLLPDALQLAEMEGALEGHVSYIWKSTVVMGGIYMFFLLERFLKYIIGKRGRFMDMKNDTSCSMNIRRVPDADAAMKEMPQRPGPCGDVMTNSVDDSVLQDDRTGEEVKFVSVNSGSSPCNKAHASSTDLAQLYLNQKLQDVSVHNNEILPMNGNAGWKRMDRIVKIAPVAWMIIFGDGFHNFIDGLSIGAAFSHNTVTGFSLSVAVLCEELPHELGDFAILLNSGMSMKMALICNFLSACMCYLGVVFGIVIGENTDSAVWIFAIAAGMFLYISLVDMMPEVIQLMESEDAKSLGRLKIFIIQNLGLFMGYGLLLLMAIYGDKITF